MKNLICLKCENWDMQHKELMKSKDENMMEYLVTIMCFKIVICLCHEILIYLVFMADFK